MPLSQAVLDFDEISNVYDATRDPLEARDLEAITSTLRGWGIQQLVEVGVGTGRIASPLLANGFEVTGLDASWGMLAKARAKHLPRLVRGSAYRLPFGLASVDAALFVHVLHILDEPVTALREACRVSRRGAVGLVRPAPSGREDHEPEPRPRRIVIDLLRKDGIELPERAQGGPPLAERRLLAACPPDHLVTIREDDVTEPLARELEIFEHRASRWTLHVPPDKLAAAVATARTQLGERTHTYHRHRALALWEHPPLGARVPSGSDTRPIGRSSTGSS